MPRKKYRRGKKGTAALKLLEGFAVSTHTPIHYRIFCACAVGVIEGTLDMVLVLPGTPKPKAKPEAATEPEPPAEPEPELDANAKRMLEELNATDTQGN